MKYIAIILTILYFGQDSQSQTLPNGNRYAMEKSLLPVIYIEDDINIHFRSPEPIQFLDLSSNNLLGDIAASNVARIKMVTDTTGAVGAYDGGSLGIVTIVGESFMAQYNVMFSQISTKVNTDIQILPEHMKDLDFPKYEMTINEFRNISHDIMKRPRNRHIKKAKNLKMVLYVNQLYTVGNYIFVDVYFKNKTKLRYDFDQMFFSIEDKKIYKSTNTQSIYIEPVFQLYDVPYFKSRHRNIYVFEKLTFPNNKLFRIRSTEDQLSGRTIQVDLKYRDLLNADTL